MRRMKHTAVWLHNLTDSESTVVKLHGESTWGKEEWMVGWSPCFTNLEPGKRSILDSGESEEKLRLSYRGLTVSAVEQAAILYHVY